MYLNMKFRILFFAVFLACLGFQARAQQEVTIWEILQIGEDGERSVLDGEYVTVQGVVMTEPANYYDADDEDGDQRYSFWIQQEDSSGKFSGLQIRANNADVGEFHNVESLADSTLIEVTGEVGYFSGEIQINLTTEEPDEINPLDFGRPITAPVPITVGDLNDETKSAVENAQEWRGAYVVVEGVTVVDVTEQDGRNRIEVEQDGNIIDIWDSDLRMRNAEDGFIKPTVGQFYSSVAGIAFRRNFEGDPPRMEIQPFRPEDMVIDESTVPPTISQLRRNPVCPASDDEVTVSAEVTHSLDVEIVEVNLLYKVGTEGGYTTIEGLENSGSVYSGAIPAQAEGSFVHYYIEALDANGNTKEFATGDFQSYSVNDNGCAISDIQRVTEESSNANWFPSGYRDMTVTNVTGVVTASASEDNLGYMFIQEPGRQSWAGIQVIANNDVRNYNVGDSVTVTTAVVDEDFGHTMLVEAEVENHGPAQDTIEALVLDSEIFSDEEDMQTINTERYESMLVRFESDFYNDPENGDCFMVVNAVFDTSGGDRGMDWRVGEDAGNPDAGIRVMTGGDGGDRTSKNVPYINNGEWAASLNQDVEPVLIDEEYRVAMVQGIVTYDWSRIKVVPRVESDLLGVKNDGTCDFTVSRSNKLAEVEQELVVYPNPAQGVLNIRSTSEIETAELFDVNGKAAAVRLMNRANGQISLDVSSLPGGVFVLRATDANGRISAARVVVLQ